MILYSVYKNLGNKNKPDWSETPILSGKSESQSESPAELLNELTGDNIADYMVFANEATMVMACDAIVVETMEIEGE